MERRGHRRRRGERKVFAPAAAKPAQTAITQEPGIDGFTIGQRLKLLRIEAGVSQRELACPGVSYAYISRIEAGVRQPSVKALRKLADKLDCTVDYLEFGVERSAVSKSLLRRIRKIEHDNAMLRRDVASKQAIIDALLDKYVGPRVEQ